MGRVGAASAVLLLVRFLALFTLADRRLRQYFYPGHGDDSALGRAPQDS